jgi:hypothetical protein
MSQITSKEHYEIMDQFESVFKKSPTMSLRYDREDKALWKVGHVYQDGQTNNLFIAFRHGCSFGKLIGREG